MKTLREIVPLPTAELRLREADTSQVHVNKGIGTLKHLAKTSQSKTMKFYISSSAPDASMYSGDSQYHTHHSLGARASQIQGAITHHPNTDTYKYQAWHSREGKNVETTHPKLDHMEKFGVTRGKWNSDDARVEE